MFEALFDYTFRTIFFGTAIFGVTSAIIGSFAFVRKQSLLGDVISHATLPGLALAFYYTQSKQPFYLLMGGAFSALCAIGLMTLISHHTRLKKDAALGIVLSVFFGFGLVCLSWLAHTPHAQQGIIIKLIFGNAATLMHEDLYIISSMSILILAMLALFWKECKLISFDPTYAQVAQYRVLAIELLLTILTIGCIIVGLQLVGVILMSTALVAPAAAARQWTQSFNTLVMLAAIFGFTSCITGTIVSTQWQHIPTGPMIALIASLLVVCSLGFRRLRGTSLSKDSI